VLLELCDSQITYRSRYLSGAAPLQVLDLVLLDPDNPRSLAFQVEALVQRISGLPPLDDRNLPEQTLLDARAILAPLQAQAIADVDSGTLHAIEIQLLSLSDRISERYFLPNETVAPRRQGAVVMIYNVTHTTTLFYSNLVRLARFNLRLRPSTGRGRR
jgi:uncharacterized alpha-E superfamily protein